MRINLIVINLKGFYVLPTVPGLRAITGVTQLHILQRLSCEKLERTVLLKAEFPSGAELKPHTHSLFAIINSHLSPFCHFLSLPSVPALLLGAPTPVLGRTPPEGPCHHPGRLHSPTPMDSSWGRDHRPHEVWPSSSFSFALSAQPPVLAPAMLGSRSCVLSLSSSYTP